MEHVSFSPFSLVGCFCFYSEKETRFFLMFAQSRYDSLHTFSILNVVFYSRTKGFAVFDKDRGYWTLFGAGHVWSFVCFYFEKVHYTCTFFLVCFVLLWNVSIFYPFFFTSITRQMSEFWVYVVAEFSYGSWMCNVSLMLPWLCCLEGFFKVHCRVYVGYMHSVVQTWYTLHTLSAG